MKKRVLALVLMLLIIIGLFPCAVYAATYAPYSLKYLKDIPNAKYITYEKMADEDGVTNATLEIYDIFGMMRDLSSESWDECIQKFRNAFIGAGFQEVSFKYDSGDYNGDTIYYYGLDTERFLILGEQESQKIWNESGIAYVQHFTMTNNNSDTSANQKTETVTAGFSNFKKINTYNGFNDVSASAWYQSSVKAAYELGLVKGNSDTTFNPNGNITIAETIALASRLNSIYSTGKAEFVQGSVWYQVYVDYATSQGIITTGQFSNFSKTATRAEFATIMANSLPKETFSAKNNIAIGKLPDVSGQESYGPAVYMLYNAGILAGSDSYGTFNPQSNITRAEVATIVTRLASPSLRTVFTLADKQAELEKKVKTQIIELYADACYYLKDAFLNEAAAIGALLQTDNYASMYSGYASLIVDAKYIAADLEEIINISSDFSFASDVKYQCEKILPLYLELARYSLSSSSSSIAKFDDMVAACDDAAIYVIENGLTPVIIGWHDSLNNTTSKIKNYNNGLLPYFQSIIDALK